MLDDLFLPRTESLQMREIGFDKPCLGYYYGKDPNVYTGGKFVSPPFTPRMNVKMGSFRAPTYHQSFRWFREKHDLFSFVRKGKGIDDNVFYCYEIQSHRLSNSYDTYEEAELTCIKKLIEVVKEKSNQSKDA